VFGHESLNVGIATSDVPRLERYFFKKSKQIFHFIRLSFPNYGYFNSVSEE